LGTKKIRWLATLETKDKVMLATHQDLDEWMLPLRK
jgi:hypothetical protein